MQSIKEEMISVEKLTKKFKNTIAVDTVSFTVKKGEVFGFLGPNGAGKTTTIKAMLGLIKFHNGKISLNGYDIIQKGKQARAHVGYLPERIAFYANLTAKQNLLFYTELKKIPKPNYDKILPDYGLQDTGKKRIREFSKGMVQRLGMAQALLAKPAILILDEPSGGLDPRGVKLVRDRIRTAKSQGSTIFLSSHILSEVQAVCDRVGIINKGKLVAQDSVQHLGQKLNLKPKITVQVEKMTPEISTAIQAVKHIDSVNISGKTIEVVCDATTKAKAILAIAKAGGNILNLQTEDPSLEEVFMRYTEE